MENSIFVHVINGLDYLVHVELDSGFRQVVATAFYGFVHVHVHQLEDEGQATRGLIVEYLVQCDNIGVRGKTF